MTNNLGNVRNRTTYRLGVPLRFGFCAMALLFAGCAQLRIVADERNPSECELSKSVCGWSGDLEGGRKEFRASQEQSIGAVSIHSSYWQAWGTVLTFGIWQPFDVICEVNDDAPKGTK